MITRRHLSGGEVIGILEVMGLDPDSPDDETFDRHGSVKSWGHDGKTVFVFYSNDDDEYSITDA